MRAPRSTWTLDYLDGFQAEADRMINATLTETRFEETMSAASASISEVPHAVARAQNKVDDLVLTFRRRSDP